VLKMNAEMSLIEKGPMAGARVVRVAIAPQPKDYDIVVSEHLLDDAGGAIRERLGVRRCVIVTDQSIAPHYLKKLEASVSAAGHILLPSIVIPPGEAAKSLPGIHELSNNLFERMVDRQTLLIALGGGVVGDLTGFAAAIILRGIDFVQVPTTLLAQVDSSVGGKTGINSAFGKNTVGSFHQPRLVLADVSTLGTLSPREMKSGYAEIVKYGLDSGPSFFLVSGKRQGIAGRIRCADSGGLQSCEYKAQIDGEDEYESGRRAI
jgi:3-dehydroquinate synthase